MVPSSFKELVKPLKQARSGLFKARARSAWTRAQANPSRTSSRQTRRCESTGSSSSSWRVSGILLCCRPPPRWRRGRATRQRPPSVVAPFPARPPLPSPLGACAAETQLLCQILVPLAEGPRGRSVPRMRRVQGLVREDPPCRDGQGSSEVGFLTKKRRRKTRQAKARRESREMASGTSTRVCNTASTRRGWRCLLEDVQVHGARHRRRGTHRRGKTTRGKGEDRAWSPVTRGKNIEPECQNAGSAHWPRRRMATGYSVHPPPGSCMRAAK